MSTQTSSLEAIKEHQLKFSYCSHCHRFRQICCYLKEKPVCADCSVGKLKLIDPPPPPVQPKKKQRVENHKRYELLAELKTKLIECLQGRCLSSKELFQACGKNHYNDYDSFIWFLRILHLEGSIYSCRWRANGSNYHVLPDEKELLYRRIGYPPEERILKVLEETKALGVSKIARLRSCTNKN